MSTPLALIAQGSFTSTGAAVTIGLPSTVEYFVVRNRSTWSTNPAAVVESQWYRGFGAGAAQTITASGAGALSATGIAAGGQGFTLVDYTNITPGPLVATGTAVSQANGAVVLDASSPAVGNIVRLFNTTGMLQIAGMDFTVTAVNPGVSYTLGYLDSSAFIAPATNADYRVVSDGRFYPSKRYITKITAANPAVVTTSVAHNYTVGAKVTIHNSDANFGMPQIDGLTVTITGVTAGTFTTDLDASAFTAFAFPTSAVAANGVTQPTVDPVGEIAYTLTEATQNVLRSGMYLGTGVVGANGNIMDWQAYGADYVV